MHISERLDGLLLARVSIDRRHPELNNLTEWSMLRTGITADAQTASGRAFTAVEAVRTRIWVSAGDRV